jgi:hypothetical protein
MFNTFITLILYNLVLPAILLGFATLWLYLFPEYWWGLMLATIIALFWYFPLITNRFEKFK